MIEVKILTNSNPETRFDFLQIVTLAGEAQTVENIAASKTLSRALESQSAEILLTQNRAITLLVKNKNAALNILEELPHELGFKPNAEYRKGLNPCYEVGINVTKTTSFKKPVYPLTITLSADSPDLIADILAAKSYTQCNIIEFKSRNDLTFTILAQGDKQTAEFLDKLRSELGFSYNMEAERELYKFSTGLGSSTVDHGVFV